MPRQFLTFLGFCVVIFAIWSDCQQRQPVQELSAPGVATIPVANDRASLDALATLNPSRLNGFRVANPARVKVIERGFGAVLVEVLDGDQAGRRGWVFAEWVSPK